MEFTTEENHLMVAQLYEVTPDLTVYCHDDCYAALGMSSTLVIASVSGVRKSSGTIRYWTWLSSGTCSSPIRWSR